MNRVLARTVALSACGVVLLSSIDVNNARRCTLLDEAGKPIAGAFVTYQYTAGTKMIWPWAYHEGPVLIRTGDDGQFHIPTKVHLRFPLVTWTSPVRLLIGAYIPRLHSACTLVDPAGHDSHCAKPGGDESSFQMLDLAARPPARFRTLWLLICAYQPLKQAPAQEQWEMMAAVRKEYDQFLSEYGNVVFANSHDSWGHIKIDDWTEESGENRPWSFFLQRVPFYGSTMEQKLSQMEKQIR
jgi:hypothetical protein